MKLLLLTSCYLVYCFGMPGIAWKPSVLIPANCQVPDKKTDPNKRLEGLWATGNKDLTVHVFEVNGLLYGKLSDFTCTHKIKKPLKDHLDDKNPDPKLRSRSWLNTIIVFGLRYAGNNKWEGGYIYDLTSGKTYQATVSLRGEEITVRGYWGIELIGRSVVFRKIIP